VVQKREHWRGWRKNLDPRRLIFIDETWAKTNMTRLRGRALRGERLIDKSPHGHWKTTTLIAALGLEGVRCSAVVDGAVNSDVFGAFVKQVLVPELRPGDIVVMDNLSSHKGRRIRRLIERVGAAVEYLPPYSPDLNPIEMVFSKIKQLLRTMACRTKDALWRSMQSVLNAVTATDATNCFKHAGYSLHAH
jgi:transposase